MFRFCGQCVKSLSEAAVHGDVELDRNIQRGVSVDLIQFAIIVRLVTVQVNLHGASQSLQEMFDVTKKPLCSLLLAIDIRINNKSKFILQFSIILYNFQREKLPSTCRQ